MPVQFEGFPRIVDREAMKPGRLAFRYLIEPWALLGLPLTREMRSTYLATGATTSGA